LKDDPDPNLSWLYLSDFFSDPWLILTGKALLLLLILLVTAFSAAFETQLESLSGNKQKPGNDLLPDKVKLKDSLFILQFLLKSAAGITMADVIRDIAGITNPNVFYSLVLLFTFIMLVFGHWVVVFLPANKGFEKHPFAENFLLFISVIFSPLVNLGHTLKLLARKKLKEKGYLPKEKDKKSFKKTGADLLKASESFNSLTVKQVMRSRMDITAFNIEMDFHDLLLNINESGFSRVPVFRETIDKIEGILYIKDILPYISRGKDFPWQNLLRPAYFVPENKKIEELLTEFQERHNHAALVVDGYGGISGLITMEDILEEIVGEINDELDEVDLNFIRLAHNVFIFDAKISLNDFSKAVGVEPDFFSEAKGESESLGGLLLQMNSNLPKKGDKIFYRNFVFRIESASNKRIKKVKVKILEEKEANQDAEV
jgi:gliding motility-associated protein GldE